jgi:hypothetical protein
LSGSPSALTVERATVLESGFSDCDEVALPPTILSLFVLAIGKFIN